MNLVLTIASGEQYQKIAEITHPSIKAYADKICAEFLCIDESDKSTPHWEKFQIFDLLNKYDRIIYLDTDLIIRDDCPNLFYIVPHDALGMFNEGQFVNRQQSIYEACKEHDTILPDWDGKYYNSGVMVISRKHKYIFKKPKFESCNYYEQGYLNWKIATDKPKMFDLPYWFNRMNCMDRVTGQERHASYIIHYAGCPNIDLILPIISKDIEKWKQDSPEYDYKYHILIDVTGGLGDQVDAEPAIRFMMNNVYNGHDIQIRTHFPMLFKHLGLPVYHHNNWKPANDIPYFRLNSLPGPETINWFIVSNLLCHTVDFVSIALMKRTLPILDKQIRLTYTQDDLEDVCDVVGTCNLHELVLVHPGRHWQSKTFPLDWWNNAINSLYNAGLKVCLVGQDAEDRGVVGDWWMPTADIDIKPGMIDTRDRLSLGGLVALIANAGTLISNDSAPIHIAGAFNNNIIVIPSCKHPEHILPYRNGSVWHKARALYKSLPIDEFDAKPTTVYDASAEFTFRSIIEYLPEPVDIVNAVLEMMNYSEYKEGL